MTRSAVSLARLFPPPAPGATDTTLLRAFKTTRSDAAFEELVRRHAPMVLATCRRVLGNPDDADDAFQAVFLVLARKVATVRGNLAGWLYVVAVRTARGVRIMRDRRLKHESRARAQRATAVLPEADHDLAEVIDQELARLPEHYREAIVLCELRGLSRKHAAIELDVPEGTLSSRLAMAKRKLAARLSARGLAPASLAALAPASVSASLIRSAVTATGGTVGSVASAAASMVVKAMLLDQLRGVALAVGILFSVICGVWAMTGAPGGSDSPQPSAPAPRLAETSIMKSVEQLGAEEFTDREVAGKTLRKLGTKAKPALRAGLKSDNPEIRERSAKVLAAIRRDQLWVAFAKLVGDDRDAQDLFAKVMGSPRAVNALEVALDDPQRVDEVYRTRTAKLMRITAGHPPVDDDGKATVPTAPDVWAAPAVPLGDVAGWLLLGALQSGTANWRSVTHNDWESRLSSHVPFLPEDDYTSARPIADAYNATNAAPLKKLTAEWLAKRRENDMLRAGLALAIRYDVVSAVDAARGVLSVPKPTDVESSNVAASAVLLGLYGTKDDLPLLVRHAADDRCYSTFLNLPPGTDLTFTPSVQDGRDLFCHVRDAIATTMCKLANKNPADFGFPEFPATKHPNRKPTSLTMATKIGFKARADRTAAFAKAAAWIKSFEPPAEPR